MPIDIGNLLQPGRAALLLSEVQRSVIGDKARLPAMAEAAAAANVIPNSARLAAAGVTGEEDVLAAGDEGLRALGFDLLQEARADK